MASTLSLDRPLTSLVVEERPYTPYGSAVDLWFDNRPEVLVSGPAGTGKSRACLEKLHFCAENFPGMRGLILRKTRESLVESALVTWEQHVVPADHPCLRGPARASRRSYKYPNGSEIIVGGLRASGKDMTQKVMSTEYDLAYVQEAIELTNEDWEKITTRLRNGKMPFQQLIADTNPDAPTHWLKKRCDAGATALLESRHQENPVLWDWSAAGGAGAWTEKGATYIAKLDALTGNRKQRLRFGRWVQAEGVVYTEWDRAKHIIHRDKAIPTDWTRFISIDFGYTNPFVALFWVRDADGRLYCYRQIYLTGRIVAEHAKQIKQIHEAGYPVGGAVRPPQAVICDHDAEDMATLRQALPGWNIVPAKKSVDRGIEAAKARLKPAGDGKPRLFFVAGNLVERDSELEDQKRPTCTEEEMDCYIWDKKAAKGGGQLEKDEPLKEHDHGCDSMRYMVAHLDLENTKGSVPKPVQLQHAPHRGMPGGTTAGMPSWMKGRR